MRETLEIFLLFEDAQELFRMNPDGFARRLHRDIRLRMKRCIARVYLNSIIQMAKRNQDVRIHVFSVVRTTK